MKTQIQTQIRSLSSLLESLREGIIQVPPFQRDFVWDREKVKSLFDSIRKSYPIGSILLWRPREAPNWERDREVGGFTLPNLHEPKSYVLDGCQRLSSLFGCLTNPNTSGLECNEKRRKDFFDLHFDLKDDSFIYPAGSPKPYQVPVYTLTSTSEFRQYTRQILEPAVKDPEELDSYLDRADAFARMLVDYKLAVIEVDGASLNDAVNIFSRINSKGTEISLDWMVNALSFSKDFNFSFEVDSVIQDIARYNFSAISRNTIFRCYQSAFDNNLYIDTNIETLAQRKDFVPTVKQMSQAIIDAVGFLYKHLNVIDSRLLPYTAQLVFLSVFFMHTPKPDKDQIEALKRWFWITTYSNYFTTLSLSGQRRAFAHFIGYINGEQESPLFLENNEKPMSTMPWPRTLVLSSVRCVALVLFQLYHQQKLAGICNDSTSLVSKKIFRDYETAPENMIISFSQLNAASKSNDLFFMPNTLGPKSEFLHQRKAWLQDAEQQFVQTLGIDYLT